MHECKFSEEKINELKDIFIKGVTTEMNIMSDKIMKINAESFYKNIDTYGNIPFFMMIFTMMETALETLPDNAVSINIRTSLLTLLEDAKNEFSSASFKIFKCKNLCINKIIGNKNEN
jgi:hypothetical protein